MSLIWWNGNILDVSPSNYTNHTESLLMFYVFMETADRPRLSKSEDNLSLHLHSWKGDVWLLDKDAMWRQAEARLSSALQLWQLQYKQT